MDVKPDLLYLEKKTTQTLHKRFSEVLMEQLTKRKVLYKGRQRSMVLRLRNIPRSQVQGASPRGSVWTRIGWDRPWRSGAWNFRNKYRRRARFNPAASSKFSPTHSGRFVLLPKSRFSWTSKGAGLSGVLRRRRRGLGQTPRPFKGAGLSGILKKRRLQGGGTQRLFKGKSVRGRLGPASSAAAQRRVWKKAPPTRKQLDSELDQYMSKTKSRLDAQLDEYMSMSRSRLDADLEEYMAMAGQGDNASDWG